MSATELFKQAKALPIEDRVELTRQLCDNLADEGYDVDAAPTPEQLAELEERAERLRRHPEQGIPWEQVRAELKDRLK